MEAPPRWGVARDGRYPTRGPLLVRALDLIGTTAYPWQADTADIALEYHPDTGHYHYPTVGVCVDRQAGKTRWWQGRVVMQLMVPRSLVLYLSYDRAAGRFKWQEQVAELMSCATCGELTKAGVKRCPTCGQPPGFASRVRSVTYQNQQELLWMRNGARYTIATPQGRGGRSLSADLVGLDEAFAFEDLAALGAIAPTLATRPFGQFVVLSSAGTAKSVLLAHFRDLGRAVADNDIDTGELDDVGGGLAWFEWAPTDARCAVNDEAAWTEACPSLGLPGGPTVDYFQKSAATVPEATFRREWLNIWSEDIYLPLIEPTTWEACHGDDPIIGVPVLGLSISMARDRASVGAAGQYLSSDFERVAVEVIHAGPDVEWIVAQTAEIAARHGATVIIDSHSPAGARVEQLRRKGITVDIVNTPEVVKACGDFHDAVMAHTITHRGDFRLTEALAGAVKRKVGQSWAWGASTSVVDITPLEAVTLARWGALNALIPGVF